MSWPVIVFGMVLPWLLLGFACWLGLQVLRQNGRILLQIEALAKHLTKEAAGDAAPCAPPGLPVGTEAPAFSLPDLAGQPHALAEYRGRPVLLIFINPQCSYCVELASGLAALPTEGGAGRPIPLLITAGDVETNRAWLDRQQVRCQVLLQKETEVADLYQAAGTPVAYLIDEQGRIATGLAVGVQEVLSLTEPVLAAEAGAEKSNGSAGGDQHSKRGKVNRGLQTSGIPRDGLKAGTSAPDFRLPRLDGGDLALSDYRGRRVLLVFSDPECGPCMELAPRLEQLQLSQPGLQLLMVSRRSPEANRAKILEHKLTYPVVLQKSWEISRLYAMFATPIGYLIDEKGAIAREVASGVEPILALAGAGQSVAR